VRRRQLLTAVAIVLATPEPRRCSSEALHNDGALLHPRSLPSAIMPRGIALLACLLRAPRLRDGGPCRQPGRHSPQELRRSRSNRIFELFGGKDKPWIVLVADADRDAAMTRADRIAERRSPTT
jgi:hypothetical protein